MKQILLLIPFLMIIPAYADSEFQNAQFGYSISVPEGWVVDDQSFTSTNADYDKLISTAAIYDKKEWTHYIEISFVENDNLISNYSGAQYFKQVNAKLAENCKDTTIELDGFQCINHAILGNKETTINGRQAYQITDSWTEVYQDKTEIEFTSLITDIPMNNDVWNIEVYNIKQSFEQDKEKINSIIESFEITEIPERIPDWIKDTMAWYLEGKVSEDEMINALQFLIKENVIVV
ncbi:MAG: hypothetical protein J4F36_11435 [Nitrosopumilaceae archaeon]|nr:hypothetical protein [Nitrosopumilaceae archaeon]